jgi:hypothetical protein
MWVSGFRLEIIPVKKSGAVASLLILLVAVGCFAQSSKEKQGSPPPDLNGVWVLDEVKSKTGPNTITNYILTIEQREPEIRIVKRFKHDGKDYLEELTFYTDGRAETKAIPGPRDSGPDAKWSRKTKWSGKKLVIRSVSQSKDRVSGTNIITLSTEIVTKEEWELSEDSQTLVCKVTTLGTEGLRGTLESLRLVFTRLPSYKGKTGADSTGP